MPFVSLFLLVIISRYRMGGNILNKDKVVVLEDRIPKLKQRRKQKANKRLIFSLSLFFVLIITVIYFQSPLSNISSIVVKGNQHISKNVIIELSQLTTGTSFWTVNKREAEKKIIAHKEIKNVVIDKQFPNKLFINVIEEERVAYLFDEGTYYPILENGQILSALNDSVVVIDAPLLLNWTKGEEIQEMVAELEKLPPSVVSSISEIHLTPELADPLHITLFMNDGFEVSATIRNFSEKMASYPTIINQLDPETKGVIHLEVGIYFKAYEKEGADKDESEG